MYLQIRRKYYSVLCENTKLKQDERNLFENLRQKLRELDEKDLKEKGDMEEMFRLSQQSEYIEALNKVIKTLNGAFDVSN